MIHIELTYAASAGQIASVMLVYKEGVTVLPTASALTELNPTIIEQEVLGSYRLWISEALARFTN